MRNIGSIENLDSLKALIKQDLRELGIKVPKTKKSKKQKNNQDNNKERSFGIYLSHVACEYVQEYGYVPRLLVDAKKVILENIDQEGLFRKSGSISRQKELLQQVEEGKTFKGANVFDVTSLIKQFFRMLPEPLFTSIYHDTFIKCYQLPKTDSTTALLLLCNLLPGEHLSTLRFMMNLCSLIATHSEKNKMDPVNLSVVLAPNLMHINSKSEKMNANEEKLLQIQTSIVEVLIRNSHSIGLISDSLSERASLMVEMFGTDDELDATEETLEDSKDCRRKEKKRKRSGSFQGIVSSIAQSISKWRRSTDGKIGNLSHASNMSAYSNTSMATSDKSSTSSHHQHPPSPEPKVDPHSLVTPVVLRKRKASEETAIAFSTTKKKAIIQNLPNHTTLANTPFTPATVKRAATVKCARTGFSRGNLETPTAHNTSANKNPRKKLNLFSPAGSRKSKRRISSSNLSQMNTSLKRSKNKGILRRLSSGKEDKPMECNGKPPVFKGVGQRLASSSNDCSKLNSGEDVPDPSSPVSSISNMSVMSHASEPSVLLCHHDEDASSLNEGFIMSDDDESGNASHMNATDIQSSVSDSMISCYNNTDKSINLSRCSTLKRGQPNSVKAGLLNGEKENVIKLRRSFGLDKSEISDPIPLLIPDIGCSLESTMNFSSAQSKDSVNSLPKSCALTGHAEATQDDDQSKATEGGLSEASTRDNIMAEKDFNISADNLDSSGLSNTLKASDVEKKSLVTQSSESTDSLLSGQSRNASPSSPKIMRKTLPRSMSTDSGQGSLMEEPGTIGSEESDSFGKEKLEPCRVSLIEGVENSNTPVITTPVVEDHLKTAPVLDLACKENSSGSASNETQPEAKVNTLEETVVNSAMEIDQDPKESIDDGERKGMRKSISTLHCRQQNSTVSLGRSHSIHQSTLSKKMLSAKPNLQMSSETQKLLTRAGYLPEKREDSEMEEEFKPLKKLPEDFLVMGPPPPRPNVIPNKRESIMQLQINIAGRVKNSVRDIEGKHSSPYRFSNSVSAKKGLSPLKIPPVFVSRDTRKGQARVPISTQLIKPSEQCGISDAVMHVDKSQLTRKPSIYYAKGKPRPLDKNSLPSVQEDVNSPNGNKENVNEDSVTQGEENNVNSPMNKTFEENHVRSSKINRRKSLSQSPHRQVKRLGSPGSPRHHKRITSPGRRIKTTQLSAVPQHLQDEIPPML